MHDQFGDGAGARPAAPVDRPGGRRRRRLLARCATSDAVALDPPRPPPLPGQGRRADRLMAELLGRAAGYSRGRGGSMHIAIPEIGLLGTNGIVGAGLPIATGAAYGMQAKGADDVTVCFFGEGAVATGAFGEALNIAALWKLPLVFICENNQYVELTPQDAPRRRRDLAARRVATACPGVRVDGNDVDAVADAVGDAVDARPRRRRPDAGRGRDLPLVRPLRRRRAAYRDEDEVASGASRDPLVRARAAARPDEADAARRRGRAGDRRRARVRPAEPGRRTRTPSPSTTTRGRMTHDHRRDRDPLAEVLAGHQPGARRGDGARRARRPRRRGRRPARRPLRRHARPARHVRRHARARHADQRGRARRPRRRRRAPSACGRSSRSCSSTSR